MYWWLIPEAHLINNLITCMLLCYLSLVTHTMGANRVQQLLTTSGDARLERGELCSKPTLHTYELQLIGSGTECIGCAQSASSVIRHVHSICSLQADRC
jgi:hypothetical protein